MQKFQRKMVLYDIPQKHLPFAKRVGFKKVYILNESYDKSMKVQNIVLKQKKLIFNNIFTI